jgi:predicted TIM-barrel fold metal-dependent hydrolase
LGINKIVFATDYPHFDSGAGAVNEFLAAAALDDDGARKILWDNTLNFYGISVT